MYQYLFAFFYRLIEKKHERPRFETSGLLHLAVLLHILCLNSLVNAFWDFSISDVFSKEYFNNKYSFLPIVILIWVGVYLYYTPKKIAQLLKKYENINILSLKNIIVVSLIYIIPFIIMVKF